ncbi:uncharacterized protein LOC126590997 [Malus sylvestris]|uniref:uncharacterized protein LOC126590997 n=1 Tax=Malus sylvestris TaxID=3752 RepID=UPI0021AC1DB6|nr:uncharacterized protein LOC126590997 [Malus sylvestris]
MYSSFFRSHKFFSKILVGFSLVFNFKSSMGFELIANCVLISPQLAISLATKAASFARELKSIRSDLCFMQKRCALLEEENRRLRDWLDKGLRPEEDDLVMLQLEALLAEKSRLANENSNLVRENQCLHQVVEYHQLTIQDLSTSFEQVVQGLCLDFSSPPRPTAGEANGEDGDGDGDAAAENKVSQALRSDLFGFSASLDDGDH